MRSMRQATLSKNQDDAEGQSRGPYDPAPLAVSRLVPDFN
jgi:hypothetical protein